MRTKQTPTPSTSAASETDPLGGSLLGQPAGDVRRVESDVETVDAASVDLPELLQELDDEQVEHSLRSSSSMIRSPRPVRPE